MMKKNIFICILLSLTIGAAPVIAQHINDGIIARLIGTVRSEISANTCDDRDSACNAASEVEPLYTEFVRLQNFKLRNEPEPARGSSFVSCTYGPELDESSMKLLRTIRGFLAGVEP